MQHRVMHGSLPDRYLMYREYPPLLELDMLDAYDGNPALGAMTRIMLPRLSRAVSEDDREGFAMWLPFARRLAELIGYY